jgi:hypothetical protein
VKAYINKSDYGKKSICLGQNGSAENCGKYNINRIGGYNTYRERRETECRGRQCSTTLKEKEYRKTKETMEVPTSP